MQTLFIIIHYIIIRQLFQVLFSLVFYFFIFILVGYAEIPKNLPKTHGGLLYDSTQKP